MDNKKKDKSGKLTGSEILLSVLIALAGSLSVCIALMIGIAVLNPELVSGKTVEQPSSAPQPVRSTTPAGTPSQSQGIQPSEPSPAVSQDVDSTEESYQPAETQTQPATSQPPGNVSPSSSVTPSETPSAEPSPSQSAPVASQTPKATTLNADGTYTHDFSGGRVLITTESNNNNDPVYHAEDCQAARKIHPESEYWYESAQAAKNDGRRLCGYCAR